MTSQLEIRTNNSCSVKHDQNVTIYELHGTIKTKEKNDHIKQLEKIVVAQLDILKGASSKTNFHPKVDQSLIMKEGVGRLVINGITRTVTPGDVVKIPKNSEHEIFNDNDEKLSFFCTYSPSAIQDNLTQESTEKYQIYTKRKEDCVQLNFGNNEYIYEFIGVDNGNSLEHSIAQVEFLKDGHSSKHFHPECEESYIVLEGEGELVTGKDAQKTHIKKGDVVKIPSGLIHQIFNKNTELLKLCVVCAPAWKSTCSVYI